MTGVYSPFEVTVKIAGEDTVKETDLAKAIMNSAEALARKDIDAMRQRIEGWVRERALTDRYIDRCEQVIEGAGLDLPER